MFNFHAANVTMKFFLNQ